MFTHDRRDRKAKGTRVLPSTSFIIALILFMKAECS